MTQEKLKPKPKTTVISTGQTTDWYREVDEFRREREEKVIDFKKPKRENLLT